MSRFNSHFSDFFFPGLGAIKKGAHLFFFFLSQLSIDTFWQSDSKTQGHISPPNFFPLFLSFSLSLSLSLQNEGKRCKKKIVFFIIISASVRHSSDLLGFFSRVHLLIGKPSPSEKRFRRFTVWIHILNSFRSLSLSLLSLIGFKK